MGSQRVPITQTILDTANRHPDRIAIAGADGRLTYAELVEDSRRVFGAIDAFHRAQGEPPTPAPETRGTPITAVSLDSAFHTARIVAGLAGYRAVSATIDPRWPLEHRINVILTAGIGLVISESQELADALYERGWTGVFASLAGLRAAEWKIAHPDQAPRPDSTDLVSAVLASTPLPPPPTVRDGDEAFLLLFSSGTTSAPKGFLKTRAQYRANVAVSSAHLEPLPGVPTLAPGPVSYSLTLYALIECLATGGSAHMSDAFDAVEMAARVHADAITRVVAVPAIVQSLTDAARRDPARFASLELVVTGGANLSRALRDGFADVLPGARLISYYGAAEIGFIGDSRDGDGTRIRIYGGVAAEIRSDAGERLPDGEVGALWIRAGACSDGYLAGTTDATLVGEDGWATVHDQGRIIAGQLELAGRAGDIVVTGGHKVALPEVERAFADAHLNPDTRPEPGTGRDADANTDADTNTNAAASPGDPLAAPAVCAIALPHPRLGSIVALIIEADAGTTPDKAALRAHAAARLAPQFVPRQWYRVTELPRTVGGKIRRAAAQELVTTGQAQRL